MVFLRLLHLFEPKVRKWWRPKLSRIAKGLFCQHAKCHSVSDVKVKERYSGACYYYCHMHYPEHEHKFPLTNVKYIKVRHLNKHR